MQKALKKLDAFTRNVIIVFAGTTLVNVFNLLYQLLIAHKLSAVDFAAFNSLLSIFVVISSPLGTIQMAVAKYSAEFNAHNQINKVKSLLSNFLNKTLILAIVTLFGFLLGSIYIINLLKIPSSSCGYILAVMLASAWLSPVFLGGIQGLELFGWFTCVSIVTGILKLAFVFFFILVGYNIAGALGALLASTLIGLVIFYFPLRKLISINAPREDINYDEIFIYLFPVALSYFCFFALVNVDMVLVQYFFSREDSGLYSLAQMVGKIFLFLPGAVSIVMFPRTSGLNAMNMDTTKILKKSLLYVFALCILACIFYNLFPAFVLRVLTGKVYAGSILLGRLFSVSMSLFTLVYILVSYFLSIKDLRFIKYLVLFGLLQFIGICLFHKSLIQVQSVLCINAAVLFVIHLVLAGSCRVTRPHKLCAI